MGTVLEAEPMAKRQITQKQETMPMRLGIEAMEVAKIAASLKGLSLVQYATQVLFESANRDIDEFSKARVQGATNRQKVAK